MNRIIIVDVPAWMQDKLAQIATICGESIDYVAASFFAAEVVHTQGASATPFCPRGGTHPNA